LFVSSVRGTASAILLAGVAAAWSLPLAGQHPPVLEGRVIDRVSGAPIAGARLGAAGRAQRTTSDGAGVFTIRGLEPGAVTIEARVAGYRPGSVGVELRNGQVVSIRLELDPEPLNVVGLDVEVRSGGAGVAVVDRAALDDLGPADLGTLLDGVPGVVVTRRGGPGAPATASIRGSSPDQVLVLLDGVPMNASLTGEADLSTITLDGIERITVVPGAQSARFGPRALGGVILIEGRTPGAADNRGSVSAGSWGSAQLGLGAGGTHQASSTEWAGRLSGEWRRTDGDFSYAVPDVRGGGTADRINADARTLTVSGFGGVSGSTGEIQLIGNVLDLERGMPGPITSPTPQARQEQRRLTMGVSGTVELGPSWSGGVDADRHEARFRDPSPGLGEPIDDQTVARGVGGRLEGSESWDVVDFLAGGEVRFLDVRSTTLDPGVPERQTSAGLWSALTWREDVGAGWSSALTGAIRVDRHTQVDGLEVSPRLSGSVSSARVTLRASIGNGFSPPSLADQFFQDGLLVRPNPDLAPERIKGEVQLGADVRLLTGRMASLGGTFGWHHADVEGMILWFPDHRFVWSPNNFDVSRQGWEAGLDLTLPTARTQVRAGVARSVVEYAGPVLDGQVAYRPEWTGHGSVTTTLGPWSGDLSGRYVGSRHTVPGSRANSLDPYLIADLRIGLTWRLASWRAETRLNVLNVADVDAAMIPDYPLPGRSWGLELRLHPTP